MKVITAIFLTLLPILALYVFLTANIAMAKNSIKSWREFRGETTAQVEEVKEAVGVETFNFGMSSPLPEVDNPTPPPTTEEPDEVPVATLDPSHTNCVGPDGKTFRTTKEACDTLNSDWAAAVERDRKAAEEAERPEEKKKDKHKFTNNYWGWGRNRR